MTSNSYCIRHRSFISVNMTAGHWRNHVHYVCSLSSKALSVRLNLIFSHFFFGLPGGRFPKYFLAKILYIFFYLQHSQIPSHLLHFATLAIVGDVLEVQSYFSYNMLSVYFFFYVLLTCNMIYLYNKNQQDALFYFQFISIINLYMFRAGFRRH